MERKILEFSSRVERPKNNLAKLDVTLGRLREIAGPQKSAAAEQLPRVA